MKTFPLIIYCAICQHILWGIALLFDPEVVNITAINEFFRLFPDPIQIAFLFFLVAISALVGLLWRPYSLLGIFLLLPQQFVLFYSATGAISAIINSAFADHVIRSRGFIFADQLPAFLLLVFHTLALLQEYVFKSIGEKWK